MSLPPGFDTHPASNQPAHAELFAQVTGLRRRLGVGAVEGCECEQCSQLEGCGLDLPVTVERLEEQLAGLCVTSEASREAAEGERTEASNDESVEHRDHASSGGSEGVEDHRGIRLRADLGQDVGGERQRAELQHALPAARHLGGIEAGIPIGRFLEPAGVDQDGGEGQAVGGSGISDGSLLEQVDHLIELAEFLEAGGELDAEDVEGGEADRSELLEGGVDLGRGLGDLAP